MENEKKQKFKKPKGSKMSDEQQSRKIGFVSGSEEEQRNQETSIEYFCGTKYVSLPSNYTSNFSEVLDLKCDDEIIIDNLTNLSKNCEELATRLLVLLKNSVWVEPTNKEHRELLNWGEHLGNINNLIKVFGKLEGEERALLGLKDLVEQIFKGTES